MAWMPRTAMCTSTAEKRSAPSRRDSRRRLADAGAPPTTHRNRLRRAMQGTNLALYRHWQREVARLAFTASAHLVEAELLEHRKRWHRSAILQEPVTPAHWYLERLSYNRYRDSNGGETEMTQNASSPACVRRRGRVVKCTTMRASGKLRPRGDWLRLVQCGSGRRAGVFLRHHRQP